MSDVRTMDGLPVIKEDGERLAFENPKPGSHTIHVARIEEPPKQDLGIGSSSFKTTTYSWSVCGNGASRGKQEENAIYIQPNEFDSEYIVRDGDVVGKLCGNCRRKLECDTDE